MTLCAKIYVHICKFVFLSKRQPSLRRAEQADSEDGGDLRITSETGCILCKERVEVKEKTDIPQ